MSVASILILRLFLPGSLGSRQSWLQRSLRASYHFHSSILRWLRPYVGQTTGIDMLAQFPRSIFTLGLSAAICWAIFEYLNWGIPVWLLLALLAHGLFVGLSWERIERPEGFKFGARLE
jgi:hypothetical protein